MGHMAALGHSVKELEGGILGLGGHEAQEKVAVELVQLPEEICKVVPGL